MSKRLPRRRSAGPADRGSGSLEFAVLSLAFLLLVFMAVQAALYYHARNVVKAEAEGTARAVRGDTPPPPRASPRRPRPMPGAATRHLSPPPAASPPHAFPAPTLPP